MADEGANRRIFEDALRGIERSNCKDTLSFEPYSYKKLKDSPTGLNVRYYLEAL
jgi:hypothetical protein